MMRVYIYDIEKDEYGFGDFFGDDDRMKEVLCSWRFEKLKRLSNENVRRTSFFAGMLFQKGLQEIYGIEKDDISISENENGKPELSTDPAIHFNISHSGKYVGVAFSDSDVGLDIEYKDDRGGKIASRMFTEAERLFIESADNEDEKKKNFLVIWTRKESFLKYIGEGIRRPLNSFNVISGDSGMTYKDVDAGVIYETKEIGEYVYSICRAAD